MKIGRRSFPRTLGPLLAVLPVLAAFSVIGSATKVGPSLVGCAQASSLHHAALVVEHGDGAVITVCVPFAEDSITGDQLIARSRVQYATADYGGTGKAVCQIANEPAQYPPGCWTASSPYWALVVSRSDGSWTMSSLGISSQTFRDGDAEGFRYEGQSDYAVPPPPRGVCPLVSSPTPIPVTTATPTAHSVTKPTGRATSAPPSSTPPAAIAAPPPPTVATSAPASPSNNGTSGATVVTAGRTPPSQPASSSTGAWAASGLGAVLLMLLVAQLARARRRPSPPRAQP